MFLKYYSNRKRKLNYDKDILDSFMQTSIMCFSNESGEISHILVIRDNQLLQDIIQPLEFLIKNTNLRASIYQCFNRIKENSFTVNVKNNTNWQCLDEIYNSQVQKRLLKEQEIKNSIKQTKNTIQQAEWERNQEKIREEHLLMLSKRNNTKLNKSL